MEDAEVRVVEGVAAVGAATAVVDPEWVADNSTSKSLTTPPSRTIAATVRVRRDWAVDSRESLSRKQRE